MWHQRFENPPMSPRQSARQPAPWRAGVFQALVAADQHQQGRFLERREVGIDHLHAVLQGRHPAGLRSAQMPLAPPADGAEVDVVDVGMAIVLLAQPPDEVQMGFQGDGIIHVGDRERSVAVVVRLKLLAADLGNPSRVVRVPWGGRTAHDPKRQLLPRVVGFLQHLVQERRVELPRLAAPIRPSPSGRNGLSKESTAAGSYPACWCSGMSPTPCRGWRGFRPSPRG